MVKVLELCHVIRKDAVPLVDAFNLSDFVLNSPLGRHDGDVYTHYFAKVRARNPPSNPPPYFESVIKPLVHREIREEEEPPEDEELKMKEEEEQ